MLIYVATHPRCGAAVLRDTIAINWRHRVANFYTAGHWSKLPNLHATDDPAIISYQLGRDSRRRMLVSPCRDLLTRERRTRLACDSDLFFVKTHEFPPTDPIAGEIAVQLVRHPAAAIVSHARLYAHLHEQPRPLSHFSDGDSTGGRWDQYHQAWEASGIPLMRLRFEDVLQDTSDFVSKLSCFLSLPIPDQPRAMSAETAHKRNPVRNPVHGADGWVEQMTVGDLIRIWTVHGLAAEQMGYSMTGVSGPMPPLATS